MRYNEEPGFWMRLLILIGICLMFTACASKPEKRFVYDPSANPSNEIQNLQFEMTRAETEQIAFFAPKSYAQANKHLEEAREARDEGESNSEILEELSLARSYFEQARTVADRSLQAMPEVADAREKALIAGASRYHRRDLQNVDEDLIDVTSKFERRNVEVPLKEKTELQRKYSDLELRGIKAARLGDIRAQIEGAKKRGASRYAPRTLASAESRLKNAEMTINTDRHNDGLISAVVDDAAYEAGKLMRVTEISSRSGRAGNEALALDIFRRDEQINALNTRMNSTEAQLTEAQRSVAAANRQLANKGRMDELYASLAERFDPKEAEVLRQGENIIVRIRALSFPSGRSDIPASAFPLLNKVKDAVTSINASKIVVEGHSDATGAAPLNRRISQQRAESVARYIEPRAPAALTGSATEAPSGTSSESADIEAVGYGFDHPIANNKTKAGRAMNRRVDVVITPDFSTQMQ